MGSGAATSSSPRYLIIRGIASEGSVGFSFFWGIPKNPCFHGKNAVFGQKAQNRPPDWTLGKWGKRGLFCGFSRVFEGLAAGQPVKSQAGNLPRRLPLRWTRGRQSGLDVDPVPMSIWHQTDDVSTVRCYVIPIGQCNESHRRLLVEHAPLITVLFQSQSTRVAPPIASPREATPRGGTATNSTSCI